MSKLYNTVSSSLFTKNNKVAIPEWIENINFNVNNPEPLDITFEKTAAFSVCLLLVLVMIIMLNLLQ